MAPTKGHGAAKPVRLTTPRLTLRSPWLHQPDFGTAADPKPDGEYSTLAIGRLEDPDVLAFIAALTPLQEAARAEAEEQFGRLPPATRRQVGAIKVGDVFTTLDDRDTEQPTGDIQFKFAMKASGISRHEEEMAALVGRSPQRWRRRPDIFDSRAVFIRDVPTILGGTIARISCDVTPFFIAATGVAGLKLTLAGVQIIRLVTEEPPGAPSHGFTAEDGYIVDKRGNADEHD